MKLEEVVKVLETFAPLSLASNWDNVGLLIEPTNKIINNVFLTNDLTPEVLIEAIENKSDMIISYHPPIFRPIKKLTQSSWKEKILVQCLENKIALFSPHTSWDAVLGGVNDWLIKPFAGTVKILNVEEDTNQFKIDIEVSGIDENSTQKIIDELKFLINSESKFFSSDGTVSIVCSRSEALSICCFLEEIRDCSFFCHQLHNFTGKSGAGRVVHLEEPLKLLEVVEKTKRHLGLTHLQVALANGSSLDSEVKSIACCAGSGATILKGVKADVYLTGEMSHHEVLDANNNNSKTKGASVILCQHSNSERGFLNHFAQNFLKDHLPDSISILVSSVDKDPITIL